MHWYDDLPHVGYDVNGKKVLRPARGDELDKFLETVEDPSSWLEFSGVTTLITDFGSGRMHLTVIPSRKSLLRQMSWILSAACAKTKFLIRISIPTRCSLETKSLKSCLLVAPQNPNEDGSQVNGRSRRYARTFYEMHVSVLILVKVMKIVRAIRQGRILPSKPKASPGVRQFYSLWSTPADSLAPAPLAAPKTRLPTHAESYNPPPEYLPDPDAPPAEKDEDDKSLTPRAYSALRLVPGYDRFINERFDRLLDLYLAPRVQRRRLPPGVTKADDLIPQLPDPKTLRPFPTYRALFLSHQARVRAICVSPGGEWVVSADEVGEVKLWEMLVGKEVKTWRVEGKVSAIDWCPRKDVAFFVVGV